MLPSECCSKKKQASILAWLGQPLMYITSKGTTDNSKQHCPKYKKWTSIVIILNVIPQPSPPPNSQENKYSGNCYIAPMLPEADTKSEEAKLLNNVNISFLFSEVYNRNVYILLKDISVYDNSSLQKKDKVPMAINRVTIRTPVPPVSNTTTGSDRHWWAGTQERCDGGAQLPGAPWHSASLYPVILRHPI